MNELVSIIITTYKGQDKLSRAINSALNQTYKNIEILVVDDNPSNSQERIETDELMIDYVKNKNVKYIKHLENMNGAVARNTGIRASRGHFISFLDDDDYYKNNRIEECVKFLGINKECIGVYTGVDVINESENTVLQLRPDRELTIKDLLLNDTVIGTGSNIFLKKECVTMINGFDETFIRRQDIEFMIRVCKCGKIGYIKECLVIKSTNSNSNVPSYNSMKNILEKFSRKFEKEIASLGNEREYWFSQYLSLLHVAEYHGDRKGIKEAYTLANQCDAMELKEKIKAFLYLTGLRHTVIVERIIECFHKVLLKNSSNKR